MIHTFKIKPEFSDKTTFFVKNLASAKFVYEPYITNGDYQYGVEVKSIKDAIELSRFLGTLMKTEKPEKIGFFKKIFKIFAVVIIIFTFTSCANHSPIIGGPTPFIVSGIQTIGEGKFSKYTCDNDGAAYISDIFKPSIVLPSRKYNVGDTIKPTDFK